MAFTGYTLGYKGRADNVSRHIKLAAHETNGNLYRVIQSLPLQIQHPASSPTSALQFQTPATATHSTELNLAMTSGSPPLQPTTSAPPANPTRKESVSVDAGDPLKSSPSDPLGGSPASANTTAAVSGNKLTSSSSASNVGSLRIKPPQSVPSSEPVTPVNFEFPAGVKASGKTDSPVVTSQAQASLVNGTPRSPVAETNNDDDAFDVRETVNVLTLQFLSDHAETRIAALEWLLMLHLKAPQKVSHPLSTFLGYRR